MAVSQLFYNWQRGRNDEFTRSLRTSEPIILLYKIGRWTLAFLSLIVLEHALPIIHPVLGLIQIPLIALFCVYLFDIPLSIFTVFAIGFLSDVAMFSPDGAYFITILLFFILSRLFSRTLHAETYFATTVYLMVGTILFFFLLSVSYFIALWLSDSGVFVMYWSPSWLVVGPGINLALILTIYTLIEVKKRNKILSFR